MTHLLEEVHAHGKEEGEARRHLVDCQARLLRTPAIGGGSEQHSVTCTLMGSSGGEAMAETSAAQLKWGTR